MSTETEVVTIIPVRVKGRVRSRMILRELDGSDSSTHLKRRRGEDLPRLWTEELDPGSEWGGVLGALVVFRTFSC